MKTTLTTIEAAHRLIDDENANWSRAGAFALVEYLEELENDNGIEIEFCPVELRCDWTEYKSLQEFAEEHLAHDYDAKPEEFEDAMIRNFMIRNVIEENTALIEFRGGILVQSF